jgi:PAS domain-containing protein
MKTANHKSQKVAGLAKKQDPGLLNKNPIKADGCPSYDVLQQQVAKLEQQLAEFSTKNAELTRSNEAYASAQRLLETIMDNMPDLIYCKDTQSRFLKCSRALAKTGVWRIPT